MLQFDTRQIRYFVAVAEELHFRRADERLNLAQPSLSRAIQQLEHAIGVRLLERTNRRVALTPAGAVFLRECRASLQQLDTAAHLARRADMGVVGHLIVAYTDFAISGVLPRILERFRDEFPDISIELVHMFTDQQIAALKGKTIDFGFMTGPVEAAEFSHITVQKDRFVVVLPEEHPLAVHDQVSLIALRDEPLVAGMSRWWGHYLSHLHALCLASGFKPRIVHEASNSEGIFGLVAAKMGVAIHPECARNYHRKGLTWRMIKGKHPRICTEATWIRDQESPIMTNFITFLNQFDMPKQRGG